MQLNSVSPGIRSMAAARERPKANVLLVTYTAAEHVGTVADHVAALRAMPGATVMKVDCASAAHIDLGNFSVVILHYSLIIASQSYISNRLRRRLADYEGLKILFIQDEYRFIDATAQAIRELGIHVVYSVVHPDVVRDVYHHPWLKDVHFEYTLTGYAPDHLACLDVPPYRERTIDIGYRARRLPGWYGRHAEQKYVIADRLLADPRAKALRLDIATDESSRIYGKAWINFMMNCKVVLGTESGASVCDFTGQIQKQVEAHIAREPDVDPERLRTLYFGAADGKITISAISPRVFEAAALRTLMIMYPGRYSDVLEPGKHYVVLDYDHSNLDEVLAILRSPERAETIVDAAYRDIILSGRWSYSAFSQQVSALIAERAPALSGKPIPQAKLVAYLALAEVRSFPQKFILDMAPRATRFANAARNAIRALPPPARKVLLPLARAGWRGASWAAKSIVLGRHKSQ